MTFELPSVKCFVFFSSARRRLLLLTLTGSFSAIGKRFQKPSWKLLTVDNTGALGWWSYFSYKAFSTIIDERPRWQGHLILVELGSQTHTAGQKDVWLLSFWATPTWRLWTSASTPRRQCFGFFLIRTVNKAGRLNFTVSCQQAKMLSTQNRWNCRVQSVVRLSTVACWLNTSVAAPVLSAERAHVDARTHATHHAGCCVAKTNLLNHFWSIRVSFQVSLSVVLSD